MVQIAIRFPRPILEKVDEIVAGRLDRPDRSSVIRQLVAEALEIRDAHGQAPRRQKKA
jgi:Arc/MetJ-type ribon-helix-helix transcriptional regulator